MSFEDVPNHDGSRRDDDVELFGEPTNAIGEILSASGNRCAGRRPRSIAERLVPAVLAGLLATLLTVPIASIYESWWSLESRATGPNGRWSIAAALFASVGLVTFVCRRRPFESTFVGTDGLARYSMGEYDDPMNPRGEVLSFDQVGEVRTTLIENVVNGGYAGTGFIFCWYDEQSRPRFEIRGAHHSGEDAPPVDNPFHFALAADRVWNARQLSESLRQLETGGFTQFRLFDDCSVKVGEGFAEFQFGGNVERLEPHEIRVVTTNDGALHIETTERKWYRRGRVCRIAYDRISNPVVLLELLVSVGKFPVA